MSRLAGEYALNLAWIIALIATLTALLLGEVMGRSPCLLCWFQRIFMFPQVIVLGLGIWWHDQQVGRYSGVLSVLGAVFSLWHLGVYSGVVPEQIRPCTATGPSCSDVNQMIFGIPIPALALVAFVLIGILSALSLKEKAE